MVSPAPTIQRPPVSNPKPTINACVVEIVIEAGIGPYFLKTIVSSKICISFYIPLSVEVGGNPCLFEISANHISSFPFLIFVAFYLVDECQTIYDFAFL